MAANPHFRAKRYFVNPSDDPIEDFRNRNEYFHGKTLTIDVHHNTKSKYDLNPTFKIYCIDGVRIIPETLQQTINGIDFENINK
jgi:hypothetical protein